MIVVSGRFRLPPERIAEARPHMVKVIAASCAEPGCCVYSYAEAVDEPGLFRVYE
jgi:quinol monooxygenase YgiN